jgi:fatty-acyl-CoA synthase
MGSEFNFEPLTPTAFLLRSGAVLSDRVAVIDGEERFTYGQLLDRSLRLAGALAGQGIEAGDRVAVLAPNTHVMLEAHFGVPFAGAVLVALNCRLTPADLSYIVEHSGAKVLIYDEEFEAAAKAIQGKLKQKVQWVSSGPSGKNVYEDWLHAAKPLRRNITDERGLLALNYTSGTTGNPKGVMYHHRGAYLQALAVALHNGLNSDSVYLWTLPMFHCNGWCFPWAVTAAGATHVCLRKADPALIWWHLRHSGVTYMCGAPTVLTMLAWDPAAEQGPPPQRVRIATGGAPPTPALLARMAEIGIEVTHLYGLTESYGPVVVCEWRREWNALPIAEQARLKARQGVGNVVSEPVRVVNAAGENVPADGVTMGEIALRGNNLMLGYYRDEEATAKACPDGWFRTGDIGVKHPDGYVELKDRSKDIIISGGENIASVEVERAICSHPAVLEAAVVAALDSKWGEVPVAFVKTKSDTSLTAQELTTFLRTILAHYKVPKQIVFEELPKTATGKVQKYVLRQRVRSASADGSREAGYLRLPECR